MNEVCYVIQYDGLARGEHEIDLAELGEKYWHAPDTSW